MRKAKGLEGPFVVYEGNKREPIELVIFIIHKQCFSSP